MPGVNNALFATPQQMKLLGKIMRQCRERSGISRDRLAVRAFVTSSTLEKWEAGERLPTLDKLAHWFAAVDGNQWYREKIISLSAPALFELQLDLASSARRSSPSAAELRQLELSPFPACYWRLPTFDIIAANAAFKRVFPGLVMAPPTAARPTNFIEWLMLSPLSRDLIQDWQRHAHVLVNFLQVQAPGAVPQAHLDAIVSSCRRAPEFFEMWDTDVSDTDIHNSDFTVLDPSRSRWLLYTTHRYRAAPRGSWELYTLTPSMPLGNAPLRQRDTAAARQIVPTALAS